MRNKLKNYFGNFFGGCLHDCFPCLIMIFFATAILFIRKIFPEFNEAFNLYYRHKFVIILFCLSVPIAYYIAGIFLLKLVHISNFPIICVECHGIFKVRDCNNNWFTVSETEIKFIDRQYGGGIFTLQKYWLLGSRNFTRRLYMYIDEIQNDKPDMEI